MVLAQAVKRACDACHRRKVKCDGVNPCRNCCSAALSCTYNAVPQKKGPKGSRAKVISELRETQRQTSLSTKVQNRINGVPCSSTSGLAPTPGLLTSDLVKECSSFFFENMYGQAPILDRRQIEHQVLYMEQNQDAYCMLASMCAFVMLQPGMNMPTGDVYNLDMVPGANIISSQLLLEEAMRVRKGHDYLDNITLNALTTNFFLFGCYYSQEMHDKAWYYLREATTMIQMAGLHQEEHYPHLEPAEASRRRRIYWLFYVLERSYALQHGRPLTLQATINLPTLSDDPSDALSNQLHSFILLVNLFRPFDDAFTAVWNKTRSHLSHQFTSNLHKQLNDLVQSYACQDAGFTDVRSNQEWLKNTVWQLSNSSTTNIKEEDSYGSFTPGVVSRELLMNMASQFPGQGMELLNSGLIEKLIETAYSLTEFLSMQPASRDPFSIGPREHLSQIISIVAASRNGDYRFLPLLMSKVTDILPRTTNPMLQNAPDNGPMGSIDIFDGFGNAGMAQPAIQLPLDNAEYERKFSGDVTGRTPDSGVASHPTSTPPGTTHSSDLSSSFVGSPEMMSPVSEYRPSMDSFCAPMANDMVMNHMRIDSMSSFRGAPLQRRQSNFDMSSPVGHAGNDFQSLHRTTSDASALMNQGGMNYMS